MYIDAEKVAWSSTSHVPCEREGVEDDLGHGDEDGHGHEDEGPVGLLVVEIVRRQDVEHQVGHLQQQREERVQAVERAVVLKREG